MEMRKCKKRLIIFVCLISTNPCVTYIFEFELRGRLAGDQDGIWNVSNIKLSIILRFGAPTDTNDMQVLFLEMTGCRITQ